MKKKIIAMLLAMTMAVSLAACGQKGTETNTSESKKESTKVEESKETPKESTTAPEEEKLEYVKLKYVTGNSKPENESYDQVWAKINEMLLEDLNCEIEIEFLGGLDPQTLSLKYAANEVFDMAFDANWFGYTGNADSNAYREITPEEIHEYMPLIEEQLPAVAWEQSKVGGKIYMIPNVNYEYGTQVAVIRGDLREKYGLDTLETVEDYIEYCEVIAENEETIHAVLGQSYMEVMFVDNGAEWKSVGPSDAQVYISDALDGDGSIKVFHGATSEEMVELYKQKNEFYKKGFWPADAISSGSDGSAEFENGLVASKITNLSTANNNAKSISAAHPEWKIEICNLTEGVQMMTNSFTGNGTSINRNAENPERAMMALNLLCGDPEYNHLLQYGIQGVNWDVDANGNRISLETVYDPGVNWNFQNTVIAIPAADDYEGIAEIKESFSEHTVESKIQAFSVDRTNIQTEIANVSAVMAEYNALNYGMVDDVDGEVAKMKEALEAAGLQKVLDEVQRQLYEFMK